MIPGLCSLFYPASGSRAGSFSAITDTNSVFIQGSGTITTSAITASPVGGSSPYTYAWTYFGGDPGMTINSPTSAATTGSLTVRDGDYTTAQCICTITDNVGLKAITAVCNFTFEFQG